MALIPINSNHGVHPKQTFKEELPTGQTEGIYMKFIPRLCWLVELGDFPFCQGGSTSIIILKVLDILPTLHVPISHTITVATDRSPLCVK